MALSLVTVVQRFEPSAATPPETEPSTLTAAAAAGDLVPPVVGQSAQLTTGNMTLDLVGGTAAIDIGNVAGSLEPGPVMFTTSRIGDVSPAVPTVEQRAGEAVNIWPGLEEWYRTLDQGFEHGYTIAEPMSAGNDLVIEIDVAGGQPLAVTDSGVAVTRPDDSVLWYRDLYAFDAEGRTLAAAMAAVGSAIQLSVDTTDAVYPITVDPIITTAQKIGIAPVAGTELGSAVAVEGNLLAVSAPGVLSGPPAANGAVYVYERTGPGEAWTPTGVIVNTVPSYGDFGRSIAVNGSRIAVGVPSSSIGVPDQGVVLVYETGGGSLVLSDTITSGGADSYQFGASIDYADDGLLVIGAPGIDGGVAQTEGQVFSYDGVTLIEIPVGGTSGVGAEMGSAVAVDVRPGGGHRLIVGAPGDAGGNGLVRILDDTGTGFAIRTGFTGSGRLGSAVDVFGDRVVYNNGDSNVNVGSTPDGGANWTTELIGSFPRSSELGANHFVDLEGGTLVAGVQGSNQVQIFRFNGTDWGVVLGGALGGGDDTFTPAGADAGDRIGRAVALDGNSLIVGAPGDDAAGNTADEAGAVYALDIPAVATFTEATNTSWQEPTNWDVGFVPGALDTAILPASVPAVVLQGGPEQQIGRLVTSAGGLALQNGGVLRVVGSLDGPSRIENGSVDVIVDGRLLLDSDLTIDSSGRLNTSFDGLDPLQVVVDGDVTIDGDGGIINQGGFSHVGSGTTLTIGPDLFWLTGGDGQLRATQGTIDVQIPGGSFDATGGFLAADAGGLVRFSGDGNVQMTDITTIEVEISGDASSTANYGRLEFGTLEPNGTLSVTFGAVPGPTDSYPVVTCSTDCLVGSFDSVVYDQPSVVADVVETRNAFTIATIADKVVSDTPGGSQFGRQIDIDGDWAVVGATNGPVPGQAGEVSVLERDPGTGAWTIVQTLSDGKDGFGADVAIEGNYLAVVTDEPTSDITLFERPSPGSPFAQINFLGRGAGEPWVGDVDIHDGVLFFTNEVDTVQVWDLAGGPVLNFFGSGALAAGVPHSLTVGGDLAAGTGYAVVGQKTTLTTFVFQQSTPSPNPTFGNAPIQTITGSVNSEFGHAVALSDGTLVVGAQLDDSFQGDAGAAYVYQQAGDGLFVATQQLTPTDYGSGDVFGSDVAIDGDTIVVSAAAGSLPGDPSRVGKAYTFGFDGLAWSQSAVLSAPDGFFNERFGDAVGVAGSAVLVGAWNDTNRNGPGAGSVYSYEAPDVSTELTFDFDVKIGSPDTVSVASSVQISDLDRRAALGSDAGSSLAVASIAELAPDNVEATALAQIAVGATPLTSIVLDSSSLSAIPLTSIDIDGGWLRVIAGSELDNEPLASLTFGQVLESGTPTEPNTPAGRFAATPLTSIEVDGTPLTSIPLSAIALGATPLTSIPLTSIGQDWCDLVADLFPDRSACEAGLSTLTLTEVALRGVPLTSIPLTSIPLTSIDLTKSPLTSIPLTSIDLTKSPLTSIPLTSIDLVGSPLTSIPLTSIPLTSIPLTALPLTSIPLTSIPLTSIPLTSIPLTSIPLTSIPLTSIGPDGTPLTSIQLQGAPLTSIPLTSIVLADVPLTSIPLTSIAGPETAANDDAWCAVLADAGVGFDCTRGADPATTTLSELSVRGVPLTSIPLTSIPLTSIDLAGAPLTSIPLTSIPLTSIPLTSIPLTSIPLTSIDLADIPLTSIDLAGSPLTSIPLTSIPLTSIPLTSIPLTSIPLTSIPLTSIPLTSIVVNNSPLTSIPLTSIDIVNSPLTSIPLTSIPLTSIDNVVDCSKVNCTRSSLGDAARVGAIRRAASLLDIQSATSGIRLGEIATALPGVTAEQLREAIAALNLSIGDLAGLDDLALGDLPLNLAALDEVRLGDLGAALDGVTYGDLIGIVRDPATGELIPDLEALIRAGFDPSATLGDLDRLGDVTLGDLLSGYTGTPLTLLDIEPILGFITIDTLQRAIPGLAIDFGSATLGELGSENLGALTIGDLVGLIGELELGELLDAIDSELANYTLGDLLLALVDPGSLALGGIDFEAVAVSALPTNTVPATTFTAAFTVQSATVRDVEIEIEVPSGASFVPDTGVIAEDGTAVGGPASAERIDPEIDGDSLVWEFRASPGVDYSVEFDVIPGLRLGSTSLSGAARVIGTDIVRPASASVSVQEGSEPNDFPAVTDAVEDVVYLTYISTPTDNDVYRVVIGEDERLAVELSNLDADLDLVLWADVAADDGRALGATSDDAPLVAITDPDAGGADSEPLDDFVRLDAISPAGDNLRLIDVSNRSGVSDETMRTGRLSAGTYYIQVYGSNGAVNATPAALQLKVEEADIAPECVARGPLPNVTPGAMRAIGPNVNTLILVNESRLEQFYGAGARSDVVAAVDRLVASVGGDPTINPALVAVDSNGAVRSAYAAWDTDGTCDPNLANDVVAEINAEIIDPVRAQLEHVVFVGGDDLIPMARLDDATLVANEYEFRHEFDGDLAGADPDARNSFTSSFWDSKILSDEPYGDADARSLGNRYLYVTDIALGRLVETPADIVAALDTFVEYDGTLSIDTATVLGYDFLVDGSEAVAAALAAAIDDVDDELADGTDAQGRLWDRVAATAALDAAASNALISLNAHFDHYRSLPAIGDKVPGFEDNLVAETVAAQLGPDALLQSMVFSMGCHSGLSVSDITIAGTNADWAEELGRAGSLFVGNTGFGYGDTESIAYSELLMALFARQVTAPFDLDPASGQLASSTVGQALAWAKNEYVAGLQTFSVYDEKAVMEATFYGLPFYRVGLVDDVLEPLPAAPTNNPVAGELAVSDVGSSNLETNVANVTPSGTYYSNIDADGNDQVIVAPGRPIQPKTSIDVSVVGSDPTTLTQVAHGAIVESMTSEYVDLDDPVIATPVFDEAAGQPEPAVGDVKFPTRPLDISTTTGPGGQRQTLVIATGQYRSDTATQRLDDDIDLSVYYSAPGEADFTPPSIGVVSTEIADGVLEIGLSTSDGAGTGTERVRVLVAENPGRGTIAWSGVDLSNAGGQWSGSFPLQLSTSDVAVIVQAKDGAGNVGYATNKAENFTESTTVTPTDPTAVLDLEVDVPPATNGWYPGPVDITASGTNAISYRVGTGSFTSLPSGGSFTVAGVGAQSWQVTTEAGESRTGVVRIDDGAAPAISIATPADGASYAAGTGERIDARCTDASGATCALVLTRVDSGSRQTIVAGSPLPSAPGAYRLDVRSVDKVGRTSTATRAFTITALEAPPVFRDLTGPLTPRIITDAVEITATFVDPSGVADDYTATFDWGDGTTSQVVVGAGEEPTSSRLGVVSASHTYSTNGVYTVTVVIDDGAGFTTTQEFKFVVVYDPSVSGRVSGSGTYWADAPDLYGPRGNGKGTDVHFGFQAQYKGAAEPEGETSIHRKNEFRFDSDSYDYLILNQSLAIAEGSGTLNGVQGRRFRVQGADMGSQSYFQITIWDPDTGTVIYDNGVLFEGTSTDVLFGGIKIKA